MGMYTGLRCKVVVKPEFREMINYMMENRLDWAEIHEEYPYAFIEKFSKGFRADFIPYGSLSYMPDEWEIVPRNEKGERDWAKQRLQMVLIER